MKAILIALLLGAASLVAGPVTNITIGWTYPVDELSTNIVFRIYHTTNIVQNPTNTFPVGWNLFTNVSGLKTNVVIPVKPGNSFFIGTVYSLEGMGESPPSNDLRVQGLRRSTIDATPGP